MSGVDNKVTILIGKVLFFRHILSTRLMIYTSACSDILKAFYRLQLIEGSAGLICPQRLTPKNILP
jgi:hypothetical protein